MKLVTHSTGRLGVLLSLSLAMATCTTSVLAMPFSASSSLILAPTAVEDTVKLESQASDIPIENGDQVGRKAGEGSLIPAVQSLTPGAESSAQVDMRKSGGDPNSAGKPFLGAGAAVDMFSKAGTADPPSENKLNGAAVDMFRKAGEADPPGGSPQSQGESINFSKNDAASLNFTKTGDGATINFADKASPGFLVPAVQNGQAGAAGGAGTGKVSVHDISVTKSTDVASPSLFNQAAHGSGGGGGAGKVEFHDISVTKPIGTSSPEFFNPALNGPGNNKLNGAAVDSFRKAGGGQQEFNALQFNNNLNKNSFTGPITTPGLTTGAANKGGTSPAHHTAGGGFQNKNETLLLHCATPALK